MTAVVREVYEESGCLRRMLWTPLQPSHEARVTELGTEPAELSRHLRMLGLVSL